MNPRGINMSNQPYQIGKAYLIRTVTMIITGEIVSVGDKEIIVKDAAWIADTGRFANCLKTGNYSEVEPFPDGEVIVGRAAIIDACQINTALPRIQK
jgi:hypothetical protein